MQRIVLFFIRNRNFLLFALLFTISLSLTINSHSYHKSKFISSANFFSGGLYSIKSSITDYFDLKKQNILLHQENERLHHLLKVDDTSFIHPSSIAIDTNYRFFRAKVINNNYSKTKNYLTLKKTTKDNIEIDMGVISAQGVIGIINNTSKNYATVQSVLNTNSQIVAKFKKSNHYGTLIWNTQKTNIVQLIEIPRLAPVAVGDTIVTDGKSTIFPEGIPIGRVKYFERNLGEDYYNIDVELFTDMYSVKHVYIIEHGNTEEIKQLEKEVENEE